jgi:hypothetical protein
MANAAANPDTTVKETAHPMTPHLAPAPPLTRRFLVTAGAAACLVARKRACASLRPAELALPADLSFDVSRNGSKIGTHTLHFERTANTIRVHIAADFHIGIGFITLFRYRHRALEEWQDGHFSALDSNTDSNGNQYSVEARRTEQGVSIRATHLADTLAPANALPLTHWSQAAMQAPLFNPQNGELLHETARPAGVGTVQLASGKPIPATRYTLAGKLPMADWYDTGGLWAALDATAQDGSAITYRRL